MGQIQEGGGGGGSGTPVTTGTTDWMDTTDLGFFSLLLTANQKTGTDPTLDWYVDGGAKDSTGAIVALGTKILATTDFTQLTSATTLPNVQIKSFRQGGDVVKWAQFIRVGWTVGGTDTPGWTTHVLVKRDVARSD